MGRRIHLVRKGVPWATLVRCVLFRGAGKGLLGVSQCVCAPATSLCGGTMLAPYGDGMAKSYAKKEDGAFFGFCIFLFLANLLF